MHSHSFFRSSTTTTTTTTGVKDQQSPTQWVEIIEPKSKEKMYANLQTGNCVWDPPEVKTNLCLRKNFEFFHNILDIIILC
jgi:hypothetical protein